MLAEIQKPFQEYAPEDEVPLAGYLKVMLIYTGVLGGALALTKRRRHRPRLLELALLGVGTHKLSRIVTKDSVTAPLRAPFTRRAEAEGAGEVHDKPVGEGLRISLGYLLTCPYCTGPWIATALSTGLALWPGDTRFVLQILSAVTISDFLHLAYSRSNESRKAMLAERHLIENGAAPQRAVSAAPPS